MRLKMYSVNPNTLLATSHRASQIKAAGLLDRSKLLNLSPDAQHNTLSRSEFGELIFSLVMTTTTETSK